MWTSRGLVVYRPRTPIEGKKFKTEKEAIEECFNYFLENVEVFKKNESYYLTKRLLELLKRHNELNE